MTDNTVGSRSNINCAYIAGFLDGDGSLMLQLKRRSDSQIGIRFMATICFYQDSRHDAPLSWIRSQLHIGYLTKRNDGMSELRINGFRQVSTVLEQLIPFIRFKKVQAKALQDACQILSLRTLRTLSQKDLRKLVALILLLQSENYATKKKKTQAELQLMLGLTP